VDVLVGAARFDGIGEFVSVGKGRGVKVSSLVEVLHEQKNDKKTIESINFFMSILHVSVIKHYTRY
jgi:hypothetical protein